MPLGLFTKKFSPKKGAPRKTPSLSKLNFDGPQRDAEFGIDCGPIKLKLGSNEISFDGGEWISSKLFLASCSTYLYDHFVTVRPRNETQNVQHDLSTCFCNFHYLHNA